MWHRCPEVKNTFSGTCYCFGEVSNQGPRIMSLPLFKGVTATFAKSSRHEALLAHLPCGKDAGLCFFILFESDLFYFPSTQHW